MEFQRSAAFRGLLLGLALSVFGASAEAMGRKAHADPAPPPVGPDHGSFILRVMTYNVHGLPLPGIDPTRYADIGKILGERRREGNAPHIVALQEAFDSRTDELNAAAAYPFGARGKKGAFLKLGSGLMVLSEFPIASVDRMSFEECVSWDCFARKGVLRTQVVVPGVPFPVEIFNTHLNSDPDGDQFTTVHQTRAVRAEQMRQLQEFVGATGGGGTRPVFFPGDFNTVPQDPGYPDLLSLLGMSDSLQSCALPGRCTGDGSAREHWPSALDHELFVENSNGISVQPIHFESVFTDPVDGRMLSDHVGQEVHFLITW